MKTTKELIKEYTPGHRPSRKIRCIETGEVWDKVDIASRELGVDFSPLCTAARTGNKFKGLHFEYLK